MNWEKTNRENPSSHGTAVGSFACALSLLIAISFPALAVEPVASAPGFIVGACTHFGQGKGLLPVNLSLLRQAGVTSLRDELSWGGIESAQDQLRMPEAWDSFVRRAAAAGIQPLLILDYGNRFYDKGDKPLSPEAMEGFARYAEFVVRHFKGVVHLYEVWNEYDIRIGGTAPGSAENYAALLKKVYPRIKAIDPSITVFGGAMTSGGINKGWLERMLAAGALPYLDVVSIHSYNYSDSGRGHTPEGWADWTLKVQDAIARHNDGKPVPLYISEMGWPTQIDKRGTPPRVAGDYLARMFLLGRAMPFLKGIWWYDFQDDGWNATDNESNFGLVRPDATPKPAFFSMAAVSELMGAEFAGRADTGDPDVVVLKFKDRARKDVWAIWSAHEDDDWQITLKSSAAHPQPISIAEFGGRTVERLWGSRAFTDSKTAPTASDEITLVVRGTPWLASGDLSAVSVAGVKQRPFPEATRPAR